MFISCVTRNDGGICHDRSNTSVIPSSLADTSTPVVTVAYKRVLMLSPSGKVISVYWVVSPIVLPRREQRQGVFRYTIWCCILLMMIIGDVNWHPLFSRKGTEVKSHEREGAKECEDDDGSHETRKTVSRCYVSFSKTPALRNTLWCRNTFGNRKRKKLLRDKVKESSRKLLSLLMLPCISLVCLSHSTFMGKTVFSFLSQRQLLTWCLSYKKVYLFTSTLSFRRFLHQQFPCDTLLTHLDPLHHEESAGVHWLELRCNLHGSKSKAQGIPE